MFKNFILLAYRHFVRSPLSSFIELFGMTAGLTVFLLVMLWVFHETGYDSFNEKADRIYRLEKVNNAESVCNLETIVAPLLEANLPEVEKAVRFRAMGNGRGQVGVKNEEGINNIYEIGGYLWADSTFFDVFTFEFVAGNPKTALNDKRSAVITESLAKTFFGNQEAVGKIVGGAMVTGVIKDVPNFHIPFKMIRPISHQRNRGDFVKNGSSDSWNHVKGAAATYLLIKPNQNIAQLEEKIKETIWTHSPKSWKKSSSKSDIKYHLRPLEEIYFDEGNVQDSGFAIHGDRKRIVAYTSIAIITLLLACINFINLNNAKYFERLKEVGIKKVCGASRTNVFIQFLGEVSLLCLISMILALIFTHSLLSRFNELVDSNLSFDQLFNPWPLISIIIGLVAISLASGGFPAMYLSSFKPVSAIKGLPVQSGKSFSFKKANLVIQFSVTIILLIGSITAFRQVNFMKNADLGLAKNEVSRLAFTYGRHTIEKADVLKHSLLANPNVLSVSYAGNLAVPGTNNSLNYNLDEYSFENADYQVSGIRVDEDYMETLGLKLLDGRFFEKGRLNDLRTDSSRINNVVLNETAVKTMGLENPIGAVGKMGRLSIRVIGVIKDFHMNSLNNPILPTVFYCDRNFRYKMIIKISRNDIASTAEFVRAEAIKIKGKRADVQFLDDIYEKQYSDDDNFASLIGSFTALAILIACLGLLGVATHAIKLRIKEIGIRKTMGASSLQILRLLTAPFIKTIIISALVAVPIGLLTMQAWLDNYPYRTDLPWWVFGVACGLTVIIAAFTIIWQSWQASSQNPARLIRYE